MVNVFLKTLCMMLAELVFISSEVAHLYYEALSKPEHHLNI